MKLLTDSIKRDIAQYPIYSQDGKHGEAVCTAKFFFPMGAWTWYILEGDPEHDDFYGIIINDSGEGEYGYISVNELQHLNVFGLGVERDTSFTPTKLKDMTSETYLQKFLKRFAA